MGNARPPILDGSGGPGEPEGNVDRRAAPRVPAPRGELRQGQAAVVAVVSAGGALGAGARYGAGLLWPVPAGHFPWTTLMVNAVGCAVIGVFMVVISDVWAAHRLVRPFFGTGVLGGFTTFSTYAVDVRHLLGGGSPRIGLAYLALTPVVALAAVWGATGAARYVVAARRRRTLREATETAGGRP